MQWMRRRWAAGALAAVGAAVVLVSAHSASSVTADQYLIATGPGPGGGPHVSLFKADDAKLQIQFYAFDPNFDGGVDVALGDLNGDGFQEVVAGAGPGGGPHVRAFTDHGQPIDAWSFFAYDASFHGGVNVAVADVNGDGDKEIVTAPASGGPPLVRAFDLVGGKVTKVLEFMAYDPAFTGGVSIDGAVVDVASRGEGIVTGAGPGGGPHVKTFTPSGELFGSWFAYDPAYTGGVSVTAYHADRDPFEEIVTGALTGRGHVRSFSSKGVPGAVSFYAWEEGVETGAIVGQLDDDPHGPFVVGAYGTGFPPCSALELSSSNCKRGDWFRGVDEHGAWTIQNLPYAGNWRGGIRIAGGFGTFNDYGTVFNPTTTSTSSTAPPPTSSTTSTSTSTTTTSTTVPAP